MVKSEVHEHYDVTLGRHRPISDRAIIPSAFYHGGKRLGDIVVSNTGVPLVIWDYTHLDDGSGSGNFIFAEKSYEVIGSVYNPSGVEILLPFLKSRGRVFNYAVYGLPTSPSP